MIDLDNLVINIKEDEGFVPNVYKDHLGFDTVGYGTKMPITQAEATLLLRARLNAAIAELQDKEPLFSQMPATVQTVLAEMAYQLGVKGLLKFKRMWKHLEDRDFILASVEGLDSLWAKQTPNRAHKLMTTLKGVA